MGSGQEEPHPRYEAIADELEQLGFKPLFGLRRDYCVWLRHLHRKFCRTSGTREGPQLDENLLGFWLSGSAGEVWDVCQELQFRFTKSVASPDFELFGELQPT